MGSPAGRRPPSPSSSPSPTALNIRKGRDDDDGEPRRAPSSGPREPKDRKKRRVALVIGYVGTQYYGLQKSEGAPDGTPAVETIESTLERALFEAGYVKESNFGDLDKIGWARCSRTDKGVHAARNVVSAKLELPVRARKKAGRQEAGRAEEGVVAGWLAGCPVLSCMVECFHRRLEATRPTYLYSTHFH
jgi:tRNA pseudouridine(38-40) synthase